MESLPSAAFPVRLVGICAPVSQDGPRDVKFPAQLTISEFPARTRISDPGDLHPRDGLLPPRVGGGAACGAANVLRQLVLITPAWIVAARRFGHRFAHRCMHGIGNAFEENGWI